MLGLQQFHPLLGKDRDVHLPEVCIARPHNVLSRGIKITLLNYWGGGDQC
jgi:hypothetical protein